MKNTYYLLAFAFGLLSMEAGAQQNQKFNSDGAYQKTMSFENAASKADAISLFSKSYGLDENNSFVSKKADFDVSGMNHERHQQFYNGLKVEFGTLITHSKNGKVESINGELYNCKSLNIKPTLTSEQCFEKAVAFTAAQKYLWEDVDGATAMEYKKPVGELLIFPLVNTGEIRLAYKYDIYATAPLSRDEVYVDAHTGKILYRNPIIKHAKSVISSPEMDRKRAEVAEAILYENANKLDNNKSSILLLPSTTASAATRYSGTKNIGTTNISSTGTPSYVLREDNRTTNGITSNGIHTFNSGNTQTYPTTEFTNATTTWNSGNYASTSTTKDNAALDAHWGAEMVYDWWATVFNRNSYDNAGAQIKSWVHYGSGYDNAFWSGTGMIYGDGSVSFTGPLTALDVCGHEIGHAVCTFTSGLAYQNHSGAMNEGLSDIWGTCIEWWARNGNFNMPADSASPGTQACWKMGEDITTSGLRSMSWPLTKNNPDTYKGTRWTGTSDDGVACTPIGPGQPGANDYCGVHNNSGVLNHWFYLLTIGKTNWTNNATPSRTTTTTGIGMQKSSQITYLAERDYLTPNATYFDMRNATITVAKNLFGCGSVEYIAVMNSWYAVNVGVRYTDIDLRIGSITSDTNLACGASHSISFTLQNDGSPSISSATTTYSVDGGTANSVPWTGSALTACGTSSQNYTISLGSLSRGTHTVVITTTTTGDTDSTNNSKTAYVTVNDAGTVGVINTFANTTDALVSIDEGGKSNSLWQRGTIVTKTNLTNTVAGSAVYATKLSGNYPDSKTSYLVSQCYNLSGYTNLSVSFDMAYDLETNYDSMNFEYSTDSGATWNVLGTAADANWYNSSLVYDGTNNGCSTCVGNQWTGQWGSTTAGALNAATKRAYSHTLTQFGSGGATPASNIIFRFNFKSDSGSNNDGVFVDNFLIQGTLSSVENQFEEFAVYPNPSNGKFAVKLSTLENVKVQVFDIRGRSVYNKTFENNGVSFNQELNLGSLTSGVYILNVESAGKKEGKRIIIE